MKKDWWRSSTLWVNALVILATATAQMANLIAPETAVAGYATSAFNFINRFRTGQPIVGQ